MAEKLYYAESKKRESIEDPSPFRPKLIGPPPHHFTTTTEKVTTLNYPQLTNYRNKYYPKNIQDVIGYVNRPRRTRKHKVKEPSQSQSQTSYNLTMLGSAFSTGDPFYSYKPQDPSDINLLATASFRFAPPVWSARPKLLKQPQPSLAEKSNSNIHETYDPTKPVSIVLNIYPMNNEVFEVLNRIGYKNGMKLTGGDPRNGGRMNLQLNLYPNSVNNEKNNY